MTFGIWSPAGSVQNMQMKWCLWWWGIIPNFQEQCVLVCCWKMLQARSRGGTWTGSLCSYNTIHHDWLVVWNIFIFSVIYGIILPIETTKQFSSRISAHMKADHLAEPRELPMDGKSASSLDKRWVTHHMTYVYFQANFQLVQMTSVSKYLWYMNCPSSIFCG